jgi:hypothetical protein
MPKHCETLRPKPYLPIAFADATAAQIEGESIKTDSGDAPSRSQPTLQGSLSFLGVPDFSILSDFARATFKTAV